MSVAWLFWVTPQLQSLQVGCRQADAAAQGDALQAEAAAAREKAAVAGEEAAAAGARVADLAAELDRAAAASKEAQNRIAALQAEQANTSGVCETIIVI